MAKEFQGEDALILHGNRVGVVRDDPEDTIKFGNIELVKPEMYKKIPLSGKIVCLGEECTLDRDLGDTLHFNKYNSVTFDVYLEDEQKYVEIDVLHASDIYLSQRGA